MNGKVYVGSAKRLRRRFDRHVSDLRAGIHHGKLLQRAWNKYGESGFVYSIIEFVPNECDLTDREQWYIDRLGACGPRGYNTAPTAGSMLGFKMSAETRAKMRADRKGHRPSAKMQEAARLAWLGRKHKPETIQKMSDTKKGKALPPGAQAIGAAVRKARGYRHSQETKDKIAAKAKARPLTDERLATLKAAGAAQKGSKWTPERTAKRLATLAANKAANPDAPPKPKAKWTPEREAKFKATFAAKRAAKAAEELQKPLPLLAAE